MSWTIDKKSSKIGFSIKHMMISTVKGSFDEYSTELNIQPDDWSQSRASAQINVASIQTKDKSRDQFLLSDDFFSPQKYPFITFKSTGVHAQGKKIEVTGDLKIRDVEHSICLEGSIKGPKKSFSGQERLSFSLGAELDREDYGLTFNSTLETGNVLVGRKLKLQLELELVRPS